MTMQQETD